jgi:hypothetical protein
VMRCGDIFNIVGMMDIIVNIIQIYRGSYSCIEFEYDNSRSVASVGEVGK